MKTETPKMRTCRCGCGRKFPLTKKWRKYFDVGCKNRDAQRRQRRDAQATRRERARRNERTEERVNG